MVEAVVRAFAPILCLRKSQSGLANLLGPCNEPGSTVTIVIGRGVSRVTHIAMIDSGRDAAWIRQ
jgi:hypothetical protein